MNTEKEDYHKKSLDLLISELVKVTCPAKMGMGCPERDYEPFDGPCYKPTDRKKECVTLSLRRMTHA